MNPPAGPRAPLGPVQESSCLATPASSSRWDSSRSSASSLSHPPSISPTVSLGQVCACKASLPSPGALPRDNRGFDREIERPELYSGMVGMLLNLSEPVLRKKTNRGHCGKFSFTMESRGTERPAFSDKGLEWPIHFFLEVVGCPQSLPERKAYSGPQDLSQFRVSCLVPSPASILLARPRAISQHPHCYLGSDEPALRAVGCWPRFWTGRGGSSSYRSQGKTEMKLLPSLESVCDGKSLRPFVLAS